MSSVFCNVLQFISLDGALVFFLATIDLVNLSILSGIFPLSYANELLSSHYSKTDTKWSVVLNWYISHITGFYFLNNQQTKAAPLALLNMANGRITSLN